MDDAIKSYEKAIEIDANPKAYIGKLINIKTYKFVPTFYNIINLGKGKALLKLNSTEEANKCFDIANKIKINCHL